jgi:hypothetical protein
VSGRLVSLGIAIALLVALTGAIVAACYEVPTPSCGFLCGPNDACPDSYACANDHFCHRIGAPATLVCGTPDAGLPETSDARANDAPPDVMVDAMRDATPDAMIDAAPDAAVDAAPDAAIDAAPDAAVDAAPDAAVDAAPDA